MTVRDTKGDKTVFRQPGTNADGTIVRPMPGRRQGSGAPPRDGGPPGPERTQVRSSAAAAASATGAGPAVYAGHFKTRLGLNPLVNAASMLIAVFTRTRDSVSHPNPAGLYQQTVREIKAFETRAREEGYGPEVVMAARYVLCTALDEAVLNTPWGADSAWVQRTLLSLFHNETKGGEKFFLILNKTLNSPAENLDLIELMYLLLSLGYEGKYRLHSRGREMIEQMRDEIFKVIRTYRGEYERSLSPNWQGLGRIRNSLAHYVPMWVVATVVVGAMVFSYAGFRYWLYESSTPVVEQLTRITAPGDATEQTELGLK